MNRFIPMTLLLAVALVVSAGLVRADDTRKEATEPGQKAAQNEAPKASDAKMAQDSAPAGDAAALHPRVRIETTLGDIVVELDAEKAPISTKNFLQYVKEGFYNGTIFHRVMKTFMIQGGGYTIDMNEKREGLQPPIKNEWRNGLKNMRGTIAMARLGGNADSATAQFFINVVDNDNLDHPQPDGAAYAVFGKVVDGMNVVDEIRNTKVATHPKLPMGPVVPVVPVVIKSVKVLPPAGAEAPKSEAPKTGETKEEPKKAEMKPAENSIKPAAAAADQPTTPKGDTVQDVVAQIEKETGHPVVKTASGLMYSVIKEGTGAQPAATDKVEVHYRGTLLNGQEFDSSYKRNKPITFGLNQVIKGWTEGVGLMKTGGSSYLIIPPDLAYGSRAIPGIPPNSTLVFKVELLAIK